MRVGSDYQANIPEFDPGKEKHCIPAFKNLTGCGSLGTPIAPNNLFMNQYFKRVFKDLGCRIDNIIILNPFLILVYDYVLMKGFL